jgi:hypothetical protein
MSAKGRVMVYVIVLRIKIFCVIVSCVNKSKNSEDVVKFVCYVACLMRINLTFVEVRFGC